ncbi:microtubule-associated protein 10 [Boleophthalmus pectinirostris]|uniref:microtubule-associated protein 10 n=1 Tax=Boleophthalmus pectinirostris TaxID=150288 RepID=UPI00242B011C|nr:microtubule-associated protein 10 [Boleophthalmus pectinirostris]
METLFSFELLVDTIQMDIETKVSEELAVALRLLDFPTLIIYQPEHKDVIEKKGEYTFNRGKACFFKMNMDTLHMHLTSTPLYAMVLDVKEEIPKFIGSSHISLSKIMNKIKQDVSERSISTPSSHGQRGTVGISNLKGEKVGTIFLSYKLLSLGSSLMPHVNDKVASTNMDTCLKDKINKVEVDELHVNSENLQESDQGEGCKLSNNEESIIQDTVPPEYQETDSYGEDYMSVFCPPHLYYNNTASERKKYEEESRKLLQSNLNPIKFGDTEDEIAETVHLKEQMPNAANSSQEKQQLSTGDVTPNVIGQALRQMPLLNALLVELSQLNAPNVNQPLTVHPNLSWIYRPPSTESATAERNRPRKSQKESKSNQVASPKSKDLYSPRHCSTPIQGQRKSTPRKKLIYGTTKSFDLRLKLNCPVLKQRECMNLFQGKTQNNTSKETPKSVKKFTTLEKRRSTPSSKLTDNIETMMQNITVNSTSRESIVEKQRNMDAAAAAKSIGTPHGDTSISGKNLLIESPSRLIHIPANVESDNSAKINQSSPDNHTGKCSGSGSGRSSTDSSLSDRSMVEEDYADDFNSFETSDVLSPDPPSPSPELRRQKTTKTPSDLGTSSNSSPEMIKKNRRPVIPVPIKASRSPQRALRATYTIQRPTFGVSFSSEDGDTGRAPSKLSSYLGTEVGGSGREEERSSGDSLRSTGDRWSESKSRQSIKRFSDESSFEQKTEEGTEDELGTLDFKKGCKHISELVAQKLPGYTM